MVRRRKRAASALATTAKLLRGVRIRRRRGSLERREPVLVSSAREEPHGTHAQVARGGAGGDGCHPRLAVCPKNIRLTWEHEEQGLAHRRG